MITLIIDTSTEKSLVAFSRQGHLLSTFFLPVGTHSSRLLMSVIASGFKQLEITPDDLMSIAICTGPGSYTGIRVGVAVAYGLAFPKSLPLISFCSLDGFIPESEGPFLVFIDARLGEYYVALQDKKGEHVVSLIAPHLINQETLTQYAKAFDTHAGPHLNYPHPDYLARLAHRKFENREFSKQVELTYIRTQEYRRS